jgi:hypothetical protein
VWEDTWKEPAQGPACSKCLTKFIQEDYNWLVTFGNKQTTRACSWFDFYINVCWDKQKQFPICPSIHLSNYSLIHPSNQLPSYPPTHPFSYPATHPSNYPFIHPSSITQVV